MVLALQESNIFVCVLNNVGQSNCKGRLISDAGSVLNGKETHRQWQNSLVTRLSLFSRHKVTVDERTGRCTLLISKARPEDEGQYMCTASNPAGQDSTSAAVLPQGAPYYSHRM